MKATQRAVGEKNILSLSSKLFMGEECFEENVAPEQPVCDDMWPPNTFKKGWVRNTGSVKAANKGRNVTSPHERGKRTNYMFTAEDE